MAINIAIADRDHVTRLVGSTLEYGPAEQAYVSDFFSGEGREPCDAIRALAQEARTLQCTVRDGITDDTEIVIVRRGRFDAGFFDLHPRVRFIQRIGRQPSGVDLMAASRAGVTVACLPRPSLARTAEHAVLLMLAAGKAMREGQRRMQSGDVAPTARAQDDVSYNWTGLTLAGLYGETVGLIGLGEVGSELAARLRAFEPRLLYWKRARLRPEEERTLGVEWAELDDLLRASRYVCVQLANTSETQSWMDNAKFSRMRRDAYFINTSRGKIVDEDALFEALASGGIAGAGIDVHAVEPARWDKLRALDTLIVSPHVAGGMRGAIVDEVRAVVDNVRAFVEGRRVSHIC